MSEHPLTFNNNPAIQGNLKLLSGHANPITEETTIDEMKVRLNKLKEKLINNCKENTKHQKQLHEF